MSKINAHTLAALLSCVADKYEPRSYLQDVLYCARTHCLVATQGHRLIWLQLGADVAPMPHSFTIPVATVRAVLKSIGKRPARMNTARELSRGMLAGVAFKPGPAWPFEDWRRVVPAGGLQELQGMPHNLLVQTVAPLAEVGSLTWFAQPDEAQPVPFMLYTRGEGVEMVGCVMPARLPPLGGLVWGGAPALVGEG